MVEDKRNYNNANSDDNNQNDGGTDLQNLKEIGSTQLPEYKSDFFTINVIGQIEGHFALPAQTKTTKYEHLLPQLVLVEENPEIKGLLIILNTVGGDVEAGLAIAEMINSISKPTVSLVIGGGHSIGVPLAVASDFSFISPTATMIIHPVRMNGTVLGVPQTFEYFQKMQDRIISFVTENSKVSIDKFKELLVQTNELLNDMGTILIGKQAVDIGLIDSIGGLSDAVRKLRELIKAE